MKLIYGPNSGRRYLGISGVDLFCIVVTLIVFLVCMAVFWE